MMPLNCSCLLLLSAITFTGVSAQEKPVGAPKAGSLGAGRPASGVKVTNAVPLRAEEFPLSGVQLLDGPFRRAMETDKGYLLRLEPDRLLAGFRREAGLPRKADPYGGWETIPEQGRYSLAGQGLGHYLSALALMASAIRVSSTSRLMRLRTSTSVFRRRTASVTRLGRMRSR